MNEKSIWRVSAWISVALVTLVHVVLLGIDVPRDILLNGGAWMDRVGYVLGMMVAFFIPVLAGEGHLQQNPKAMNYPPLNSLGTTWTGTGWVTVYASCWRSSFQ